jgi:hypothetical protein
MLEAAIAYFTHVLNKEEEVPAKFKASVHHLPRPCLHIDRALSD